MSSSSSENTPSKDQSSTKEWLETILESYQCHQQHHDHSTSQPVPADSQDLEVLDWDIQPVEGDSYLSDILRLSVNYSDGKEKHEIRFIAKLLPVEPRNRAFVIQTQFDKREIKFYTEIAPALKEVFKQRSQIGEEILPIPLHYQTVFKDDCESILVMEDLTFKGFAVQNLTEGLSLQQAEKAVECIAYLHSASVALQIDCNEDLSAKYPYLLSADKAEEAFHALFEKGLPLLLKYLERKPEYASVRNRMQDYGGNRSRDIFQRVLAPSDDKVNTLIHCDFWSNNLLFKNTGESQIDCRIIDFQMVMKGKPSIDLGMLITTSLSPKARRDYEDIILSTYWNSFLKKLRQLKIAESEFAYTFEDLKSDFKEAKVFGALVMIGSVDMALGDPVREERVLSLVADLMADGSF